MSAFRSLIRNRRLVKEWTLRDLAARCNCSHGYLADVENGRGSPPSLDLISALASSLDLDPRILAKCACLSEIFDHAKKTMMKYGAPPPKSLDDLPAFLRELASSTTTGCFSLPPDNIPS